MHQHFLDRSSRQVEKLELDFGLVDPFGVFQQILFRQERLRYLHLPVCRSRKFPDIVPFQGKQVSLHRV